MDISGLYNLFRRHSGVSTDSRTVRTGDLFFALKGINFDGNLFASAALEAGAAMVVVDDSSVVKDQRFVEVEDVLRALQELAAFHRQQLKIPVIGITGSNGKTTTRELLHQVLSARYVVHSTRGNLNNHIGVPLTLLNMDTATGIAVIEMGANHPGEIERLCEIARPDYGLITNVGKAHLEGFGSFEGVKSAKGELYRYLAKAGGYAFCNCEDEELNGMLRGFSGGILCYGTPGSLGRGQVIETDPFLKISLSLPGEAAMDIETGLSGSYNLQNILAAAAVGRHFGVAATGIRQAIEDYRPRNYRSQRIETEGNVLIVDAYNANPSSMHTALDSFGVLDHSAKVLILGEMHELGETSQEEHQALVDRLRDDHWPEVYLVGSVFENLRLPGHFRVFQGTGDLVSWLKVHSLEKRLILLKGSRAVGLERLVEYL